MVWADTGHGRIGFDSVGRGEAVVLTHADLMDRRMWRAQLAGLFDRYRVIAWDRFGFGESDAGALSSSGADLWMLLDALDVDRAVLVGCSMGAGHCLDATLQQPDRVRGLVLACPGVPGYLWPEQMREEARALIAAVRADRPEDDARAMARAQVRYLAVGNRSGIDLDVPPWQEMVDLAADVFRREWSGPPPVPPPAPDPPLLPRLHHVRTPTLVIDGVVDVSFVRDLAAQLASGITGARLISLADTGHLPPMECPAQFNAILREFMNQLTPGPSGTW